MVGITLAIWGYALFSNPYSMKKFTSVEEMSGQELQVELEYLNQWLRNFNCMPNPPENLKEKNVLNSIRFSQVVDEMSRRRSASENV